MQNTVTEGELGGREGTRAVVCLRKSGQQATRASAQLLALPCGHDLAAFPQHQTEPGIKVPSIVGKAGHRSGARTVWEED